MHPNRRWRSFSSLVRERGAEAVHAVLVALGEAPLSGAGAGGALAGAEFTSAQHRPNDTGQLLKSTGYLRSPKNSRV